MTLLTAHQWLMAPVIKLAEPGHSFQPTELDRALANDPLAEARHRHLTAASQKVAPSPNVVQIVPDLPAAGDLSGHANREGQREAAAASLAGGMIAAEGRPVTAAEAVEKVQEVLEELKRRE
jgi:hypothetical protein